MAKLSLMMNDLVKEEGGFADKLLRELLLT